MNNKFFHRRSVFFSWFLVYFMLMFVPILIGGVVYTEAEEIIRNEINKANMTVLKQLRQGFDNKLRDVQKFVFQTGLNSKLGRLMHMKTVPAGSEYYLVTQVENEINFYKTVNGFVDDFYIYFNNMDRILSTSGLLDKELFYKYSRSYFKYFDGLSYEQWLKIIEGKFSGEYIPLKRFEIEESSFKKSIIFTQSFPIGSSSKNEATLIVLLNDNRFLDDIKNIALTEDGWSLILDKNNKVLFSTETTTHILIPNYEELTGEYGLIYKKIKNERFVISYISSGVTDWKYVLIIPLKVFHEKVEYIRKLTMISFVLCILLGGIINYILTWRNYNPIKRLVEMLGKKTGVLPGERDNEYRFLYNTVRNILNEKEKMDQRLKQQNAVLRSNFLIKLLKGKIEDRDFISNALKLYDIVFETDYFAVMLFYIVDFKELFKGHEDQPYEERLKLVKFIITNIIEEMVAKNNQGFMTEVDDMLACIINFKEKGIAGARHEILRIAYEAVDIIKSKFYIDFIISASNIHQTIYGIPEAYQEALSVMEYKIVTRNNQIVLYDEMKISKGNYNYPIEKEHQLINFIKAGDFAAAEGILNEVIENNLSEIGFSTDLLKCLMFDLASTMLKTLPEISSICSSTFIQELNIPERLLSCGNIHEMRNQMTDILKQICSYIQYFRNNKKEKLIESVKEYIESNYNDINLTVASIAEKFDLTPAYLTRLFKEHTNEGLFEYICKVRIEKAKMLLKDHSMNIKDVAMKVGYVNTNTFIRNFKRYEGITPGSFRNAN